MQKNKTGDKLNSENFIEQIKIIVNQVLEENLSNSQTTYGTVKTVNGDGTLDIFIEGNSEPIRYVRCNPDVEFNPADRVIVLYVNNNKRNAFVLCRREK